MKLSQKQLRQFINEAIDENNPLSDVTKVNELIKDLSFEIANSLDVKDDHLHDKIYAELVRQVDDLGRWLSAYGMKQKPHDPQEIGVRSPNSRLRRPIRTPQFEPPSGYVKPYTKGR